MGKVRYGPAILAGLLFLMGAAIATPQDDPNKKYVSQEEYEKLKKEVEALRAQVKQLAGKEQAEPAPTAQDFDELQKELKKLKEQVASAQPGTTHFLITGYGFGRFVSEERTPSSFTGRFNPIFLWQLSDRIFFEAEVELELGATDVEVGLEYAHATYILCEYVTIGMGKFLSPLGYFNERFHPAWINKLPDKPLAFDEEGIVPESEVGVQVRGVIPIATTKLHYVVYVANGARLDAGDAAVEDAGRLHFDNFEDINNSKGVGGRIGLIPIAGLDVSYSIMVAEVGPRGGAFRHVDARLHSADLTYIRDSEMLAGTIDIKFQWVWSDVDVATFDPLGVIGFGPLRFSNQRNGGYVQVSYRPSKAQNEIVRNFEVVLRYDALYAPRKAPANIDEERWTVGVDFWLGPSAVIKVAYRIDRRDDPANVEKGRDAFLLQFAIGY